jgi:hypothetical protein
VTFNQFHFVFLFLPLVVALFHFPPLHRVRVELLVAASFVFYGASGLTHAAVLAACILWVFLVQRGDGARGNPWRLALAILAPASALFQIFWVHCE